MSARRLDGRVALVSGGGAGIGQAIARRPHSEGAIVAIVEKDARAAAGGPYPLGLAGVSHQGAVPPVEDVAGAVPPILRRLETEQDEFVRDVILRALKRLEG